MSIGTSPPRRDGLEKIVGSSLYADDLRPDGCLYGATVRSSRAHARILGLRRDPAFDWTGVTLVTAADVPTNIVTLMTDDQPVLAGGITRHVHEPLALVAAPTREQALAAARAVIVDYEDLPALFDPELAEGNAIQIFGHDNVFKKISIRRGTFGGRQGIRVRGRYQTGLQEQLYIEPMSMLALPRPDGGFTVQGSMQCPYYIDRAVKRMLGDERVNVVQAVTGGGFGGKEEYPSMLACHAVLLARASGRPVKITYRRDEDLRATTKRHPSIIELDTLVSPGGHVLEFGARIVMDGGAYHTLSTVVLSRAILHVTGPYRAEAVALDGVCVATHTPPNGAFRGFGAPQAQWAAERHMDRVARTLGLDPLELRRRNLYKEGDITATGQVLHDPGGFAVLDRALAAAEAPVDDKTIRPGVTAPAMARGRGLALAWHGCGFTGNGEAKIKGKVALEVRDGTVYVGIASTDIGQGTETIFPQIVAEELGIDTARVQMLPHDTAQVPDSGPTVASRTAMVVGGTALAAARALRRHLQSTAMSDEHGFDALLSRLAPDATARVVETYEVDANIQWDMDTYQGDAYPCYGWSCVIVDLRVDTDTGEVIYDRVVTATDVGRALNPVLASGQIEGGTLQALGWATQEEVVLDSRGGMRNDRLTNYIIPTALDAPEMVTELVEIPFAGGPFGAKGIGEIPMDCPAAAVAQAIEAATGAALHALPMTPERVLAALETPGESR
ncbi:MAG: xanthine dehydrogenase family protein [Deltaproteobacteria bacterium]|nr:xanthine dehydrogenase family protein [Deltaproteobacteria bacterium]